jgi:serine/threonine protein phosphatase PrpC
MDLQCTQRTYQNNKRRPNEDYSLHTKSGDTNLFIVADGNDLAPIYTGATQDLNVSRIACEWFIADYKELDTAQSIPDALKGAFNSTIMMACNQIKEVDQHKYQSTTLTVLAVYERQYFCMHVGDGALYHFSNSSQSVSRITPITREDETTVFIEPNTLGHIKASICSGGAEPNDVLLLTTDGLLHLWGNRLVDKLQELSLKFEDTSDIVDFLFEERRYTKRHDDLTCFVIKIE